MRRPAASPDRRSGTRPLRIGCARSCRGVEHPRVVIERDRSVITTMFGERQCAAIVKSHGAGAFTRGARACPEHPGEVEATQAAEGCHALAIESVRAAPLRRAYALASEEFDATVGAAALTRRRRALPHLRRAVPRARHARSTSPPGPPCRVPVLERRPRASVAPVRAFECTAHLLTECGGACIRSTSCAPPRAGRPSVCVLTHGHHRAQSGRKILPGRPIRPLSHRRPRLLPSDRHAKAASVRRPSMQSAAKVPAP